MVLSVKERTMAWLFDGVDACCPIRETVPKTPFRMPSCPALAALFEQP
jgi:hypothetical protein